MVRLDGCSECNPGRSKVPPEIQKKHPFCGKDKPPKQPRRAAIHRKPGMTQAAIPKGKQLTANGDKDTATADVAADLIADTRPRIALPHPHALVPRRAPRWVRRAPRRDASAARRSEREGWHDPRLRTAPDGGPMRINMTYRNSCMTSADFSPTIGQDVFAEGGFEGIYRAILSTDQDTAEFQFQIATIHWVTSNGQDRHYTLDGGRITADGSERWFEMKAHASYFQLPDVADVLEEVERELANHDIVLDRLDGSKLLDPAMLRAVNEVLRHRNVPFETRDVAAAQNAIRHAGGIAARGVVVEALGGSRRRAEAMMSAMLIRREIGFPVQGPVTPDTPVSIFRRPNRRLTRFED